MRNKVFYLLKKAINVYAEEYKFAKEFGEGVKRIYREMDEANLPKPTFKKQDFMTIATIKNNLLSVKLKNEPLNDSYENIVDLIIDKIRVVKKIPKAQLSKDLGVSFSTIKRASIDARYLN